MTPVDAAETARLSEAIEAILRALEVFNRFQGPDLAGRQKSVWQSTLDRPVPQRGAGLDKVLDELTETIIPHGLRVGEPGFSGWMAVAPTTSGTAAALAGTVAGPQRWWIQPFNFLETVALRWLAELLDLPSDLQGTFTSGGSVATLVGLGAARQKALERHGVDPARDGLPPHIRCRIYASEEVHHVVIRAAGVLGLGRRSVASLPADRGQRMDLTELRKALETDRAKGVTPVALVASAGTVNTGAIDPIEEMVELAAEFETWLHVDGAYGLFGKLDPRIAPLYAGLEKADSLVVDPHKWLAAPVGCGAAFVRNRALLGRAFTTEPADYLEGAAWTGEVSSPFDHFGELYHNFNVEQSAPSRGVQVWAVLREIGVEGLRERIVRHNDFARHLASRVKEDRHLELLAEPTLSICCFRYRRPDLGEAELQELNAEIARRLRAEGEYVPSTTRVAGRFAIRPAYINPRTTIAEVDGLADRVREIGDSLVSR
ncbi:MAG: aminotransferase class V-fold PLP-dependent enzyme [Gemmatimonadetes bacterium]|uniref:Aminotransferase class V-fold PLP-dependent enzyme n=1 Tax=Candidatus Kutchimonas denitrificans TaxID=3056748 RepID=A0AAE4ZB14_9BACT|nr:aminotransferase class V-fold PLP-dependent enzyme [Gemmatimonadota bacterium]NIR75942.1 aminotransferase class V-fold PLP-dependent enzyme [Candidatus Kutchimonas denitrificans]NIS02100.1 aminotransferase class V-fold PLP-dependent enzyme [Gemmatimonadota bacterium]NIT67925.1 aminotransferase class V-fold PLP-dependent enzyme [Gemmatimonadota bacterium]NIU53919.1 aminotransferase class V-fold PLP-dependent enzyme [Gemmatimonadota bacterium]